MKMNVNYFDSGFLLENERILAIEIENTNYFYRFVNDIFSVAEGDVIEDISFFDNDFKELNLSSKINVILDYFHLELNSKKIQNKLYDFMEKQVSEVDVNSFAKEFSKLKDKLDILLREIDIPVTIESDFEVAQIFKLFKVAIKPDNSLLNNLFIYLDIEKNLLNDKIIFLVNLKDYLNNNDIEELYKYAIYNNICLILIDSRSHGTLLKNEKKIIIDEKLEELVLQ